MEATERIVGNEERDAAATQGVGAEEISATESEALDAASQRSQAEAVASEKPLTKGEGVQTVPSHKTESAAGPTEKKGDADTSSSGIESLKPGMRLKGIVRNVVEFGAFVDIGVGRDGLAHVSTLKRAGIDQTLQPGDEIDVQIRRVDVDKNRISLTIPGAGRGAKVSLKDLQVNSVVTGRIVRLVDFGAFVDIGAQTDGLIHISQLPGGYVRHPSDVVQTGDEVRVRILDVDTARRRISLSMKDLEADADVEDQPQPRPQPQAQRPVREPQPARESQSVREPQPNREPPNSREPQTQEGDSGERMPTAFEVAWQEAMSRPQRRSQR